MLDTFNRHGCDRGNGHRYDTIYRDRVKGGRILEIGIFEGRGISAWLDYFPECRITGVDIFTRLAPEDVPVLRNKRVTWYEGDSRTIELDGEFDYIFDDGNHHAIAQMETFANLYPLLKEGGTYFIEDVFPLDKMGAKDRQRYAKWIDTPQDYKNLLDSLPNYKIHRLSGKMDSCVIEVTK